LLVGGTQLGKLCPLEQQPNAARHARLSADQPVPLEAEHHLMDGWAADPEEPLHICLGRRPTVHQCIGVDEGKVLPLSRSEAGSRVT
jgi:hypothetical protein